MAIMKYDPLSEFRKSLDIFNDMVRGSYVKDNSMHDFFPTVNSREDEKAYYLEIDLPGVDKKDIDLHIEDGMLTISGERKMKQETKEDDYYKIESSYGSFSRSFTLPKKIDESKIEAEAKDGVLELTIPKLAQDVQKSKKITIK